MAIYRTATRAGETWPGATPSGCGDQLPGPNLRAPDLLGGAGLRHLAALRRRGRCRHLASGHDPPRARARQLELRLCAALAAAQGRALWRESQPPAALLSVPSDPEAVAGGEPGALSRQFGADRAVGGPARHPLRR